MTLKSPEWSLLEKNITSCRKCPRLNNYIDGIRKKFPGYWCKPVPGFGDPRVRMVVALGKMAHDAYLRAQNKKLSAHPFAHDAIHAWPGEKTLVDIYHPSRQNTQTGKLTLPMFLAVLGCAKELSGLKII